jgi:hypothetical protein
MLLRFLVLLCVVPTLSLAEDGPPAPPAPPVQPAPPAGAAPAPEPDAPPAKPVIEKIDESRYRVGMVTFDRKSREIRFPAKVNMASGLLEFLVVQQKGKVHEALLLTETSPTHLNLAFTLLRYPPSIELFPLIGESGHPTGFFPEVPDEVKAGARISIEVEWKDAGKIRRNSINDWIQHSQDSTAMPPGPWLYSGSESHQGKYIPELTGDIIAIFTAREAMINFAGNDGGDDLVWHAFPERVPAKDTEVTLIITPFLKKPADPNP